MKNFISYDLAIVLFVLMLNYLVWDKKTAKSAGKRQNRAGLVRDRIEFFQQQSMIWNKQQEA